MKKIFITLIAIAVPVAAYAQGQSLGATMDVFVFPVGNTGTDPFDLAKQEQADEQQAQAEQQAAQQAGTGSGARGAVRGAAAGALIGEIANDDASEGAAWGAAAGAVRGRRQGRAAQQQAQEQAAAQAEQREGATEQQLANFKNAFSVCLEAKEYMVKY